MNGPDLTTRLLLQAEMEQPDTIAAGAGTAVCYSSRAPHKSTPNEDGALAVDLGEGRALLAVADGVGGQRAGDRAAADALLALLESIQPVREGKRGLREAVIDGFELANERVLAIGGGAATTLAAVAIDGEQARPFHVGDSGIVITGQRGRVKLTIIEHSPVGYAVEAGLLGEDEALYHEERNLVSNIVGSASMRIDVGPVVRLALRDTVVLSSDGLTDNLMGEEIIAIARRGPLLKATSALIAAARRRMQGEASDLPSKSDDLTVITFRRISSGTKR